MFWVYRVSVFRPSATVSPIGQMESRLLRRCRCCWCGQGTPHQLAGWPPPTGLPPPKLSVLKRASSLMESCLCCCGGPPLAGDPHPKLRSWVWWSRQPSHSCLCHHGGPPPPCLPWERDGWLGRSAFTLRVLVSKISVFSWTECQWLWGNLRGNLFAPFFLREVVAFQPSRNLCLSVGSMTMNRIGWTETDRNPIRKDSTTICARSVLVAICSVQFLPVSFNLQNPQIEAEDETLVFRPSVTVSRIGLIHVCVVIVVEPPPPPPLPDPPTTPTG